VLEEKQMKKYIRLESDLLPKGFSEKLEEYYDLYSTYDIHTIKNHESFVRFHHNDRHKKDIPKYEKPMQSYKPEYNIGDMEIVEAFYEPGLGRGVPSSFFICVDRKIKIGRTGLGAALIYEKDGEIHTRYPSFEELFIPLIRFDRENATVGNLKAMNEIFNYLHPDLNVYEIIAKHDVDYPMTRESFGYDIDLPAVVIHAFMKHIMLLEEGKYQDNPRALGAELPLKAFEELYQIDVDNDDALEKWRTDNNLQNPFKK
jgi:hypothetical protein